MVYDFSLDDYLQHKRALSPEEVGLADSLVWELRDEWMYRWHKARETGLVSEILSFARNLKELGEERGVFLLVLFGRELESAAEIFNIPLMERYLNSYPDIIHILGGSHDSGE